MFALFLTIFLAIVLAYFTVEWIRSKHWKYMGEPRHKAMLKARSGRERLAFDQMLQTGKSPTSSLGL
jgi:hypothetical protein